MVPRNERLRSGLRWLPWLLLPAIGAGALWMLQEPSSPEPRDPEEARIEAVVEQPTLAGQGRPEVPPTLENLRELWRSAEDLEDARARVAKRAAYDPALLRRIIEALRALPTERMNPTEFRLWSELTWLLTCFGPDGARALGALLPDVAEGLSEDLLRRLAVLGPEAEVAVASLLDHYVRVSDSRGRRRVIETLGSIGAGAHQAGPLLHGLVRPPVDDALAGPAAMALVGIEGPTSAVLETLRAAIEDEDTEARAGVLRALAEAGRDAASFTELLLGLLEDTEERVRIDAARALGAIGIASPGVVEALRRHLEAETQRGKIAVAAALLKLGAEGQAALQEVSEHGDDVTDRLAAAEALQRAGGLVPSSAAELRRIVASREQETWFRRRALRALVAMPPEAAGDETIGLLFRLLDEPTYRVQAIAGIAARPERQAWLELRAWSAAQDEAARFSVGASLRIQKHDVEAATEMLLDLAEHAEDVRWAREAIQHLLHFEPRPDVARLLAAIETRVQTNELVLTYMIASGLAGLEGHGARVVPLLSRALAGPSLWPAARGLTAFPKYASASVPALIDAYRTYGEWAGWRWQPRPLRAALAKLAPRWSGTAAALDAAIAKAPEPGKPYLEELKKHLEL